MTIVCGECRTRNDDQAIFCRACRAFLEWSQTIVDPAKAPASVAAATTAAKAPQGTGAAEASSGKPADTGGQALPRTPASEAEPHPPEPAENEEQQPPKWVGEVVCSACGWGNPPDLRFCRHCARVLEPGRETTVRASWPRRVLRLDRAPLPAGRRAAVRKPILERNQAALLRFGLKMLAVGLVVAAIVVGAAWAWDTRVHPRVVSLYSSSREALFPRFKPVPPAKIYYVAPNNCVIGLTSIVNGTNPPALTPAQTAVPWWYVVQKPRATPLPGSYEKPCYPVKPLHSIAEAFDNNLTTYWLSPARTLNDRIVVRFRPTASIGAVTIYAGDPTGSKLVPKTIQMTVFGPAQTVYYPPVYYPPPKKGAKQYIAGSKQGKTRLYWPVLSVQQLNLQNTQAQQRFSTGDLKGVARIVFTIRDKYPNATKKATVTVALTEVEFWDKH